MLLTNLISTSHGPFRDFTLDCELDIHLVVYLKSTIDGFDIILVNCLAQLNLIFALFIITQNFAWIKFLHVFALLKLLSTLVLLSLIQTDITEEDRAYYINIRRKVVVEDLALVLESHDSKENSCKY